MKQFLLIISFMSLYFFCAAYGYKVDFTEYDLENGLHVIMYPDKTAPNVVVGVKYHVGSKNEEADRTGFAHFFEHLLFHGTENIPQGEFENIVMSAGGYSNAYTSYDVTYYYEFLPSHEYKLGLWLESERMLHPIITQEGIDRERNIVKEEKRMRYDNKPMGNAYNDIMAAMYAPETYGHSMIGSMEHLDAASLNDFNQFFKTYYAPNNACLVLVGNININETKKWVNHYFGDIPMGKKIKRPVDFGKPSGKEKVIEKTVKGLKKTAVSMAYYCMPETHQDASVLKVIAALLSGDDSYSLFDRNITKNDTMVQFAQASAELWEGVGFLRIKASLKENGYEKELISKIENEINTLKDNKLTTVELQKVLNIFEVAHTDSYFHNETMADMLTNYYHIWGNARKFNNVIEDFTSITAEDIQRVAKQYLDPQNRTTIIYYPENN